jgi:1-deoxy-D-xylulose-5-phosphate reductoisomerase
MSVPDMKGPISYALSYPKRLSDPIPVLELDKVRSLTFRKPDTSAFPCLSYAYDAVRVAGTMPCVLNASNEVAVNAFLGERIGFSDIPRIVRETMDGHSATRISSLDDVLAADAWARRAAARFIRRLER